MRHCPTVWCRTSCFAPLAKCQHLQRLDLRFTHYNSLFPIDMYALLGCVGKSKGLVKLSLPSFGYAETRLEDPRNTNVEWPPNLTELQFNYCFPTDEVWWSEIASRWPTTLNSLIFRDCTHIDSISRTGLRYKPFPQIGLLRVDAIRGCHKREHLLELLGQNSPTASIFEHSRSRYGIYSSVTPWTW